MLRIFVDADACPVKDEVYRVAKRYDLPVILVANAPMRHPGDASIRLEVVPGGFDAADDWIVHNIEADDIVVTADIPLAARSIAAGAKALGTSGKPFTEDNVGETLATRNLLADLRGAGTITGGPAPFGKKDRSRFLSGLDDMIQEIRRRRGA